jgi:hypothetical protein
MSTFISGLKVQARGNHEVVVKILGRLNLTVANRRSGSRMTAFPCRAYANFLSINRNFLESEPLAAGQTKISWLYP